MALWVLTELDQEMEGFASEAMWCIIDRAKSFRSWIATGTEPRMDLADRAWASSRLGAVACDAIGLDVIFINFEFWRFVRWKEFHLQLVSLPQCLKQYGDGEEVVIWWA